MLRKIQVIPLAAESLGVRSMCTFVETPDVRILLDAGVSLAPNRYGLPPHPEEFKAIINCRRKIAEFADVSKIVTVSHYHFDHHTPSFEDWESQWTQDGETARHIYERKTVLMKNPKDNINFSQRRRAWMFQKTGGSYADKLEVADGKIFTFSKTTVKFSDPVPHGPEDSSLGWVLMTTIEYEKEKFMFAPDVQGPMAGHTLDLIIDEAPDTIMLGGPPSYLEGFRVGENQIREGLANMLKVVERVPSTIMEHHILRDERWNEKTTDLFYKAYECDHSVVTAAEFLGRRNSFLEAERKRLFEKYPPSKEFEKWMKLNGDVRKRTKPPLVS